MKLKEMRKIWILPVTKDNSSSSENTEEGPTENKGDVDDVDVYDLSDSNSEEDDYKGSDNESGDRDSEWRLRNAYANAGIYHT